MPPSILPSVPLEELFLKAADILRKAIPENTRRAYASDWRLFTEWCASVHLEALPAAPDTVVLFLSMYADSYRITTLRRTVAAISIAHQLAKHDTPTRHALVRQCLRSIARTQAEAGQSRGHAKPLLTDDVLALVRCTPKSITGLRDAALILIGFAGAFRRSELVGLNMEDIEWTKEGILLHLRRGKTDQEGTGSAKAIFYGSASARCPVRALKRWIKAAVIESGPLFRRIRKGDHPTDLRLTAQSVSLILRRYAAAAGIDEDRLSGHSLRSGFVTQALLMGADYPAIQRQTGHRSISTVMTYDHGRSRFHRNASQNLGL
ncbi:MAG: site-specific integrase [Bacteroidota bacterium]